MHKLLNKIVNDAVGHSAHTIVWLFSLKPVNVIRGTKGESKECLPCLSARPLTTGSFIKPASINIRQNSTATRHPIEVMNVRTRRG